MPTPVNFNFYDPVNRLLSIAYNSAVAQVEVKYYRGGDPDLRIWTEFVSSTDYLKLEAHFERAMLDAHEVRMMTSKNHLVQEDVED